MTIGKNTAFIVIIAVLLALLGLQMVSASGTAGTEDDPLVSKSYVDSQVGLQVVVLQPGQTAHGEAGCEFIVRSGSAYAIGSDAGGLSDVTQGQDLKDGADVPLNHLLLTPKDDGRGVGARGEVIVMIRGSYLLNE